MVKCMLEILNYISEIIASNLEISMPASWACFTAYAAWYFTSAKQCAPLTYKEARMLWEIHKQKTQCQSKKWHEIRRKDRMIGFKCDCGYKHVQKRPLTANTSIERETVQSQTSVFDKLHTTHKST
jgi:hypothetical protein